MTKPFLKWVGGKQRLLPQLLPLVPKTFDTYLEPFLGGGAMFFALQPRTAILADVNWSLIDTYRMVRDYPHDVIECLHTLAAGHSKEAYYAVRREFNEERSLYSSIEVAATFIYLNKTCFNGLWRTNSCGEFNVPMGRGKFVVDEETIHKASHALQNAVLHWNSYEQMLFADGLDYDGWFVYLDPPYVPVSSTSFTKYAKGDFTWDDHRKLAALGWELTARGANVMISNSDTPEVRDLYKGWNITTIQARRSVNRDGKGRGPVNELVIRNYR